MQLDMYYLLGTKRFALTLRIHWTYPQYPVSQFMFIFKDLFNRGSIPGVVVVGGGVVGVVGGRVVVVAVVVVVAAVVVVTGRAVVVV